MDYEVYGGWVVLPGEGGEVGGEEFCYFEGWVDGEAVLEGLWVGGEMLLVLVFFVLVRSVYFLGE